MKEPVLTLTSSEGTEGRSRTTAIRARFDEIPSLDTLDATALQGLTLAIVDAILVADTAALDEAFAQLGGLLPGEGDSNDAPKAAGWLECLLSTAYWAIERLPDSDLSIRLDTLAGRFLLALEERAPQSSKDLTIKLLTSETQVSRAGRKLLAAGFATQRRTGQFALWELTPRGRQALVTARASQLAPGEPVTVGPRASGAARFMKASSGAPPKPRATASRRASGMQELTVQPNPAGGWTVHSSHRRSALAQTDTKQAAMTAARNRLQASARGGLLHVMDRFGQPQQSVSVAGRSRRTR